MSFISKLHITNLSRLGHCGVWSPLIISVRYRYHKDKIERGPLHRLGYEDKILTRGMLPRSKDFEPYFNKPYQPANQWSEKKAMFGRNDYIDILGDGSLKPTQVQYQVPEWLRGFKGNEYQMLLRRRKIFGSELREFRPARFSDLERRIKYLYNFLNLKKKDYYWHKP